MPKVCKADNCTSFVFGKGYCVKHQYMRTDKKPYSKTSHPIKKVSDKRKQRLEGRSEIDVFNEIWSERPHISELSGEPLPYDKSNMGMWVRQFLHVINKGRSNALRLDKRNIMLGTPDEHDHQDRFELFKKRKIELLNELYVKD